MGTHVVIAAAQSSSADWLNVQLPVKFKDTTNNSINYDLKTDNLTINVPTVQIGGAVYVDYQICSAGYEVPTLNNTYTKTQVDSSLALKQKLANVSDTEIGYLDGVTSSIQTQINSKQKGMEYSLTTARWINIGSFTTTQGGHATTMVINSSEG